MIWTILFIAYFIAATIALVVVIAAGIYVYNGGEIEIKYDREDDIQDGNNELISMEDEKKD